MTDQPLIQRGDRVEAMLYHSDDQWVTGTYTPREDHLAAGPPEGAAWVDTGDPQGPLMINAETVRHASTVRPELRAVRDAAQKLADSVRAALATDLTGVPAIRLPRLSLFPGAALKAHVEEEQDPDPRQCAVTVRAVPTLGEPPELHTYRDDRGLSWQTYGEDHNFGTDRLLEIQNEDNLIIATYPAGTWLHACYGAFREPEPLRVTS